MFYFTGIYNNPQISKFNFTKKQQLQVVEEKQRKCLGLKCHLILIREAFIKLIGNISTRKQKKKNYSLTFSYLNMCFFYSFNLFTIKCVSLFKVEEIDKVVVTINLELGNANK